MMNDSSDQFSAGAFLRPRLDNDEAIELVRKLFGIEVKTIREFCGYEDRNYFVSEDEVKDLEQAPGYVLKITNSRDSTVPEFYESQHKLLLHLNKKGFEVPIPIQNLRGDTASMQRIAEQNHLVGICKYVPGKLLSQVSYTAKLINEVGRYLGRLHNALQGFPTNGLHRQHLWNLESMPQLRRYVQFLPDGERQNLTMAVVEAFERDCISRLGILPKGIIHGDYNEGNIIVHPSGEHYGVYGVIDFANVHVSSYVFDVAIGIAYMSLDCECFDYLLAGGHFLAGYLEERKLNELEWDVIRVAVTARFAQSVTLGWYTYFQDPSNTHVQTTQKKGWTQLRRFWETPSDELYAKWKDIIATYRTKENSS